MILSNLTIRRLVDKGYLQIEPYDPECVQPASYDLHLHPDIKVAEERGGWRDMHLDQPLLTDEFALASTLETIKLPDHVAAMVIGCSTEARNGLMVECAGWVDPGFHGQLTLELKNIGPDHIWLGAGQRIAQLVFFQMDRTADPPYRGRYQHQQGPTLPRPSA